MSMSPLSTKNIVNIPLTIIMTVEATWHHGYYYPGGLGLSPNSVI